MSGANAVGGDLGGGVELPHGFFIQTVFELSVEGVVEFHEGNKQASPFN